MADDIFGQTPDVHNAGSSSIDPAAEFRDSARDLVAQASGTSADFFALRSVGSVRSTSSVSSDHWEGLEENDSSVLAEESQCVSLAARRSPMPVRFIGLPHELPFTPSILLNYYFDHVCTIVCTFDGPKNPFRTVMSARWPHSAIAFTAAQSLSAACLAKQTVELKPIAVLARKEASRALGTEIKAAAGLTPDRLNELLLGLLLLGVSSSWHDPNDMGIRYYSVAVAVTRMSSMKKAKEQSNSNNNAFFQQALTYWWMLLTLVSDPSKHFLELPPHLGTVDRIGPLILDNSVILLHPWAGISTEAQVLLGRVARHAQALRIVRQKETSDPLDDSLHDFVSEATGREVEEQAINLQTHFRHEIADPEDPEVDLNGFVAINDAYRDAILILIYRTFPGILRSRHGAATRTGVEGVTSDQHSRATTAQPEKGRKQDLFNLALHVLETLSRFDRSSRILGLTPHLLIIAAGELRPLPDSRSAEADASVPLEEPCCQFRSAPANIADLRIFALDFAEKLMHFFHFMPLNRMRDTMIETWRRMDQGEDAFWLDIMNEKGWEAFMG
ncbi:hypothetical protein A1O1_05694 [Capronia coronata CBS 617.96]|uniref:Transcription factor domain-containing protein n=1 Tax=Capronia coronata CBS 617.96 TaxID=1182541 RepID=W9Y6U4_9EURO|nr:uncharacterized protein A1O1_05694 [Capronia coronata CBS 617.96]EXJ85330.1 hypothetical protein A1O1_05694 [Capronia coronata CBS 617.96]